MRDEEILTGSPIEDSWLTLEQIAAACPVETHWLRCRLEEGLIPHAESVAGVWCFASTSVVRVRRMRQLERDFDAVPELAALFADMLEELDELRARAASAGPS